MMNKNIFVNVTMCIVCGREMQLTKKLGWVGNNKTTGCYFQALYTFIINNDITQGVGMVV